MAGDNKAAVFLVAGILVGVAIGAAVGFFMWNGGDSEETTYWFYLDYQDEDMENEWISAKDGNADSAFKKAMDENDIEYEINSYGMVNSINGVTPAGDLSWGQWLWTASEKSLAYWAWKPTSGLDVTLGDTFYIAVTEFELSGEYNPLLKPNLEEGWKTGGPFAAA